MRGRRITVPLFAAGLCFILGAPAWAQSSGTIAGIVRDTTGAAMPGVTVEATSPALIEKARTVVTNDVGEYKIEALRAGVYTVTFSLAGFSSVKREGIELTTGFTANINAELRVGGVAETITVTGATPVVDLQSVEARKVLTRDVLETVPMSKSPVGYAAALPGVILPLSSQDVGGNKGDGPTTMFIHGGRGNDLATTKEGLRITAVYGTGVGVAFRGFSNLAGTEETTFEESNQSAEFELGGIHINIIPKDGGNRYNGTAITDLSNSSLQAKNLDDDLRARGVLVEPGSIKKIVDVSGGVGGPLVQDRVWFFGQARVWRVQNTVAGTFYNKTPGTGIYTRDLSRPAFIDSPIDDVGIRFTWAVSEKGKINASYNYDRFCLCHFFTNVNVSPEASFNSQRHTPSGQATWTYPATNRFLLQAGFAYTHNASDTLRESSVLDNAYAYTEFPNNIAYGNSLRSGAANYGHERASGFNGVFSAAYVNGSHALKVGINYYGGRYTPHFVAEQPDIPAPVNLGVTRSAPGATPTGFQVTEVVLPWFDSRLKTNLGLFAQDRWRVNRFTVDAGLRFDYLNADNPAQCRPVSYFSPEICSPEIDSVPNWRDINPRIGVTYDVFGDGKTALKASLGRYVISEAVNVAQNNTPGFYVVPQTTRSWTDSNTNLLPDCNLQNPAANGECGAILNPQFGTIARTTFYDDRVLNGFGVRPYNWQGQVSVQRELAPRLGVNIGYFRTWYGNFTVTDNLNVTPADYDPYCVTLPTDSRFPAGVSGSQSCGWYDITAAAQVRPINNVVKPASDFGKQTEVFNGVDITMNWRLTGGGLLSGGVTTGRTENNNCFVADSPQQLKLCDVVLPWSAQTQVKFLGSYPLPWWGLVLSGTLQNLAGPANNASLTLTRAQAATQTTLPRPLTGTSVTIQSATPSGSSSIGTSFFTPNTKFDDRLTQVDFRLMKNIRVGTTNIRGIVEVANAFNANTILSVNSAYSPAGWLTPSNVLAARIVKFGAQVSF